MTFEGRCSSREQYCMYADVFPGQLWFHSQLLFCYINDSLLQPDTGLIFGACCHHGSFKKKKSNLEVNK